MKVLCWPPVTLSKLPTHFQGLQQPLSQPPNCATATEAVLLIPQHPSLLLPKLSTCSPWHPEASLPGCLGGSAPHAVNFLSSVSSSEASPMVTMGPTSAHLLPVLVPCAVSLRHLPSDTRSCPWVTCLLSLGLGFGLPLCSACHMCMASVRLC